MAESKNEPKPKPNIFGQVKKKSSVQKKEVKKEAPPPAVLSDDDEQMETDEGFLEF